MAPRGVGSALDQLLAELRGSGRLVGRPGPTGKLAALIDGLGRPSGRGGAGGRA